MWPVRKWWDTKCKCDIDIDRLDCGGDTCYHFNNISKRFCKHFSHSAEGLIDDIYMECKFHQDLGVHLREICLTLNIPYATPRERSSQQWLSELGVLLSNITMYDAFTLLYASWIPRMRRKCTKTSPQTSLPRITCPQQGRNVSLKFKTCAKNVPWQRMVLLERRGWWITFSTPGKMY